VKYDRKGRHQAHKIGRTKLNNLLGDVTPSRLGKNKKLHENEVLQLTQRCAIACTLIFCVSFFADMRLLIEPPHGHLTCSSKAIRFIMMTVNTKG